MSLDLANKILPNLKNGDRDKVVNIIKQLIDNNSNLGNAWGGVARIATTIGEVDLANQAAKRYAECDENAYSRKLSWAGILSELGQLRRGLEVAEPLLEKLPKDFSLHHFIGLVYSQLGETDKALFHLKEALKLKPNSGHSWLTYAMITKFDNSSQDIRKMLSIYRADKFDDQISKAAFLYAYGKVLSDIGDIKKSVGYYSKGAKIMSSSRTYDFQADEAYVDQLVSSFSFNNYKNLPDNQTDFAPIFILGLPRSGTTLLTQILSSTNNVVGGGELDFIRLSIMPAKGFLFENINSWADQLGGVNDCYKKIIQTYQHLIEQRFGQIGSVVDKSLNNSRFLGLIAKAFPKAPIIWIERDIEDTAWSCYRNFFSQTQDWSWSLENIAKHFLVEERLKSHWKELLGERIFYVKHHELISNPSSTLKKIFEFCGLKYDASAEEFYKVDKPVQTASLAQVRQPISSEVVNRSEQFREFLKPFSAIYYKESNS